MDAKQAVQAAKAYLQDVFGNELMTEPRLEEVWFDENEHLWCVTLGSYRKPDDISKSLGTFSTYAYKVVRVDANGKSISIRDRVRVAA